MQTSRDFQPVVVAPLRPTARRTCCAAVDELSGVLLKLQGDGDAIPVDVVFTQGTAVLGLR